MINDGGAERMVKNKKVEWWQVIAVLIMFVFTAAIFLFFYLISNGERVIDALNRGTVKDAYNILSAVKEKYPDVAVTSYDQSDDTVYIEFKYYETAVEKELNLLALSMEVREYMEDYLTNNPDDFINKESRKVTLRFPEVIYSNIAPDSDFEYSNHFNYVSYSHSDMSAEEFVSKIAFLTKADTLTFISNGEILKFGNDKTAGFEFINNMEGLKRLYIQKNSLSEEQLQYITDICKDKDIILDIVKD